MRCGGGHCGGPAGTGAAAVTAPSGARPESAPVAVLAREQRRRGSGTGPFSIGLVLSLYLGYRILRIINKENETEKKQ